jgi:hypothetical protein
MPFQPRTLNPARAGNRSTQVKLIPGDSKKGKAYDVALAFFPIGNVLLRKEA